MQNDSPQSPSDPVKQEESMMLVSAAAIGDEMDLSGLLSDPKEQAKAGTGRLNSANNEPQDSRSYMSSAGTAQGGSAYPVGVKSLQSDTGCTQYTPQRTNDSMDIYMLQRQGYADDEEQYRQFMYKQWKNKQKSIIAELNGHTAPHNPTARDVDKETTPPTRACGATPLAPIVLKHDSNSNARDIDNVFQLNTFAVLGQALFNDHPDLNYDDFLDRGAKVGENEVRNNRPEPDNRTGAMFVWRHARQNDANAGIQNTQPDRRDISNDDVASTSGFGGARARNKNPREKTNERQNKACAEKPELVRRRTTVGVCSPRKHTRQSAAPENVALCDDSIKPDMTALTTPTGSANKKDVGGGKKTSKKEGATGQDGSRKQKHVGRTGDEAVGCTTTIRIDDSSTSTMASGPSTVGRHDEDATATSGTADTMATTVTFDLSDMPSCVSSVSMTSSMASDIINHEMEGLDLLSGSSSAESTLSDVLLGLDVRAVIANANKFGRQHLTNGDFDKWLDVGTKLAFLQSDDPAFASDAAFSMGPTTTQSASASVLLPGRTRFPGNRAKRACAAKDDLYANKRSRGASTTCDLASLSYSQGYSDWSTSRLLATSHLISQSDTSVGSSVWSRT